ncbi:MAG: DUF1570 domain-containing protein [Planctomycetaceae bacterium]
MVIFAALLMAGCRGTPKTFTTDRPHSHSVNAEYFHVYSNFPIAPDSDLIENLKELREQISATLELPKQRDPVAVYLFEDEASYRRYMQTTWPDLPPRRAYFVGTSRELAVYSYHGPRVQEDLRHEFTHGLLHASLQTVPLWLDEGLAEYFEVEGSPAHVHPEHLRHLQDARAEGWSPSLYSLESITDFRQLTQRDYAEAWGWVHYLLHDNESARQVLVSYVAGLRENSVPNRLLLPLEAAVPACHTAMPGHVNRLAENVSLAGARP